MVFVLLVLTMTGGSDGAWCVCRQDVSDSTLQKTIDYACGAGADCSPINQNGACFNPNTVKSHCSFAVNSYYQRKGQAQQACNFAGTAALTQQDPSSIGCTFPASSGAGISIGNNNGAGMGAGNGVSPVAGSGSSAGTGTGTGGTGTGTGTGGTGTFPTPIGTIPGSVSPSTMNSTSSGVGGVMGGEGPSGNVISTDSSNGSFISVAELSALVVLIFSVVVMLTV
ncbi:PLASMODESMATA CALLOSE-BINDING PROTEIN 3-like [Phalaenopsis equestris]|uniref:PLASMODESMATA CALLOSE-BINDING PROTEIN 3-like n=1 Tax=Phalaenopsis equestris TaxID=78828 RepID=UPI0009E2F167|nr:PLASMODESMATA CALLOSE-BINDING PROTEIN 3-like [Phalaenopsis equestris]